MLGDPRLVARLDDLIGMHDLAHVAIEVEPSRHAALHPSGNSLRARPDVRPK